MRLVVMSTYPPRRCGIATFTADLRSALQTSSPGRRVDVCAIDRDGLAYGPEVMDVIDQDDRDDYRRAARAVAATGADLVVIEHEYGIFGGPDGSHVLDFVGELAKLEMPYAVTLHTVLPAPTAGQAGVLAGVCRDAARVSVFTETARQVVTHAGLVEPEQLAVVPHGVPARLGEPVVPAEVGAVVGEAMAWLDGARMLSTFGLLRPGKGLETAISALPAVVERHPDVRYVVAGATHPEVVRDSGEEYRRSLVALAAELGIMEHVRFVDAFLSEVDIAALLARTDLYLTPYRSPDQTCSGPLTFALAAGCPVVSTSYRYAIDLVTPPDAPARGTLVPFDDPAAFAAAITELLGDPERLTAARESARKLGTELTWPAIGARFAAMFADVAPPGRIRSAVRLRPAKRPRFVDRTLVAQTQAAGGEPVWVHSRQPPASADPAR